MTDTVWKETTSLLRQWIDPGPYKVWIEPLCGHCDGDACVVTAVSSFVAGFVRDNFLPQIKTALDTVAGRDISVTVLAGSVSYPREPGAASRTGETGGRVSGASAAVPVPSLVASCGRADGVPAVFPDSQAPLAQSAVPAPLPRAPLAVSASPAWQPAAPIVASQHSLPLRYDEAAMSITARAWRHSFDDFVVGPCNELAFAASRSMCKESRGADILFLSSSPGLGKTHLIQAAGRQLCKECNFRMPKVEYLTAEEFASRLVMALKSNETDRFKARYRDVDVLLLEDVHFLQGKEKMQDELLATVKTLQDRGSKVIFSSSFVPRDLRGMSDQLLSRLHSGFLAVIERPDRATRKKILTEKARLNHVVLSEEVSDFLAESIDSDVRQIESCLSNLVLKAKLLKCGITMQMAWEAVQHYAPREKKLDLEGIIAYVAQGYGISRAQLGSKSRKKELVTARNTVFYLARKHTDLSLSEIGGIFDRTHSTVIKGITSLEREMTRETSLGRQIAGAIAIIERNGGIISPSL